MEIKLILDTKRHRLSKFKCACTGKFTINSFHQHRLTRSELNGGSGGLVEPPHLAALGHRSRGVQGLLDPPRNRKMNNEIFSDRRGGGSRGAKSKMASPELNRT
jgi:hypothetical protein